MRELKFRIWCKGTSTNANFNKPRWILPTDFILLKYYRCFQDVIESDDFVVQQYTGMKDRKGVEVYEGDIVVEKITEEMAANGDSAIIGKVYFAAGTFMIDGDGPLYNHVHSLSPDVLEDFIVAGNMFQNPELLK